MFRILSVILLCYIILIVFLMIDSTNADESRDKILTRQKRYLSFKNSTKFFLRLNFKANMVPWNQIFAQALGFRLSWDEPPDTFRPYHHLYRRTVYNNLEILLDKNGLDGYNCIRRAICEMVSDAAPRLLYYKILKMVFRQQSSDTDKWHKEITSENCLLSMNRCPFSFKDVSTYTDL